MIGLPTDPEERGRLTRDEYEIGRVEGEIQAIDDDVRLEERFGRQAPDEVSSGEIAESVGTSGEVGGVPDLERGTIVRGDVCHDPALESEHAGRIGERVEGRPRAGGGGHSPHDLRSTRPAAAHRRRSE